MAIESTVGGVTLPLAAGTIADASSDLAIDLIAAYARHWLKAMLDTRLAVQTPTSADACPAANVYSWNPEQVWLREEIGKPALFVWQSGPTSFVDRTLVYSYRTRPLSLYYIFAEMHMPSAMTMRAGLMQDVDAVLARAFDRFAHPTFGFNGYPAGENIRGMLTGKIEDFSVEYGGGEPQLLAAIPGGAGGRGMDADGRVQRVFLGLLCKLTIWERIGLDTFSLPADENAFVDAGIYTNTEVADPDDVVLLKEGYLP